MVSDPIFLMTTDSEIRFVLYLKKSLLTHSVQILAEDSSCARRDLSSPSFVPKIVDSRKGKTQ
jgi:hypothetical protein